MNSSAVDIPALLLAVGISLAITTALALANRGENNRRAWSAGGAMAALLVVLGLFDLLRESPRETHLVTVFIGAALPVLFAIGAIRGTRRVRPWLRWTLVFAATVVGLFSGLQLGAAILPRYLP